MSTTTSPSGDVREQTPIDIDTLHPLNHPIINAKLGSERNPSTKYRWVVQGVAGVDGERIKLRCTYVGRTPCTSVRWVDEWLDAVTQARLSRAAKSSQSRDEPSDSELDSVGLT
ncbi:MAG: hypothetical protein KDB01_16170 [Planctomycetaceae bacterium]|nr:hypothetical protein [Planctomycetaceae bacterium]